MKWFSWFFACCLLSSGLLHANPQTIDSFRKEYKAWEVKDWGDPAQLSLASPPGEKLASLKMNFEAAAKEPHAKGIVLRRSLLGRIEQYKEFTFDIFLASQGPVDFVFSFEADRHYQLAPVPLKAGWNRNIRVDLLQANFSFGGASDPYNLQPRPDLYMGAMMLNFLRRSPDGGAIYLAPVQSQHSPALSLKVKPPATIVRQALELGPIKADKTSLKTYETIELSLTLPTALLNPFDPDEIKIEGTFRSPQGQTRRVAGFLHSGTVSGTEAAENLLWKLRFTPETPGPWTYEIQALRGRELVKSPPGNFTVSAQEHDGFVRVDAKDPYSFAFDSGRYYYPIGQNVAWLPMQDYERYFKKMSEHGENWARIWMSHWSFGIEWKPMGTYRGLNNYNLDKAEQLDQLLALAEKYGVYLQLVFDFHGAYSSKVNPEWLNNPYNKINGGFLDKAEDFFTHKQAKDLYKKRLRYIVSRWGHSPHIMAWEFFNEVSYTDGYQDQRVTAWHDEMSRFVRDIDPYQHLRTTSYGGEFKAGSFGLKTIDFAQYHAYTNNIHQQLRYINSKLKRYGKPYFVGEFGSNTNNGVDDQDKEGSFLHAGIWSQFMHDAGGNAMPWWWDSHIEPNNLYRHFGALSAFAAGIDRRLYTFEQVRERLQMPVGDTSYTFELIGLRDKGFAMYWIAESEGMRAGGRPQLLSFKEMKVALGGFSQPSYELEFWDTRTGKILDTQTLRSEKNSLAIELPLFVSDVALKIRPAEIKSLGSNAR